MISDDGFQPFLDRRAFRGGSENILMLSLPIGCALSFSPFLALLKRRWETAKWLSILGALSQVYVANYAAAFQTEPSWLASAALSLAIPTLGVFILSNFKTRTGMGPWMESAAGVFGIVWVGMGLTTNLSSPGIQRLHALGVIEETIPQLVKLDKLDAQAKRELVPVLARALREGGHYKRWGAAIYAGKFGAEARDAAPALREMLVSGDPQAAYSAAISLAHERWAVDEAIPILIANLDHSLDLHGDGVTKPLVELGPEAALALGQALSAKSISMRENAVIALAAIGPAAEAAAPALVGALEDNQIRLESALALAKVNPDAPELVPALLRLLASTTWDDERLRIIKALRPLGARARTAIPELTRATQSEDAKVKAEAEQALQDIQAR